MKDIAQFPARESSTVCTVTLTRESAQLLQEVLRKVALPLEAAKHLIPVQEQVDKIVAAFSPEHPGG